MTSTECDEDDNCYFYIDSDIDEKNITVWNDYITSPGYQNVSFYYRAAMMQGWNKFCFQEVWSLCAPNFLVLWVRTPGIPTSSTLRKRLELRVLTTILPGLVFGYSGTWGVQSSRARQLAFGRSRTMNAKRHCVRLPEPANQCVRSQSWLRDEPLPRSWAPEIDILEGGGTEISSSMQIGPGMPDDFRQLHDEVNLYLRTIPVRPPGPTILTSQRHLPSIIRRERGLGFMDNRTDHWGVNSNGTCFPRMNAYAGAYLCNAGNTASKCTESGGSTSVASSFMYQMDALSSNWGIHLAAYVDWVTYTVEWVTGDDGYVRWEVEGNPLYEIAAATVTNPPQDAAQLNPKKIMIEEPLYIIFNVALSSSWGSKPPNAGTYGCYGDGKDKKTNAICDAFPMKMKIDYVRVYQDTSTMAYGCDPAHILRSSGLKTTSTATRTSTIWWLRYLAMAPCSTDDDCTIASKGASSVRTGYCTNGRCECASHTWTGPRCTETTSVKKDDSQYGPPMSLSIAVAVAVVFATFGSILYTTRNEKRDNERRLKTHAIQMERTKQAGPGTSTNEVDIGPEKTGMAEGKYVEFLDRYALPFDFKRMDDTIWSLTSDGIEETNATFKMKRSRAPSPTRTAKDFAAANAAIAAAAAGSNGLPSDVKKPTKKRIRRQREELLYLRVKVQEMESSLAELKGKETRTRSPTGSSTQLAVNGKPSSEGSSLLASVWESLANRQYKDRERAEQENRKLKSTLEGQIKLAKCLEKILEDQSEDDHETSSKNTVARTFGHKIQSERGSLDYRSESVLECRKRGDRVVIVTRGLAKPIKFSAAPVNGIRFHENGWIVIEKASAKDGSAKGKWATIASSMELKPIFDDDASDQDFTVGALTDFVIDSFHRNMHLGEEVVAAIMTDEARKAATQPAGSWPRFLDGLMPSVWTSMAGRQLKDRMRAERENQELRNMLQDQLKIAQGLEDTLKQLPPSQFYKLAVWDLTRDCPSVKVGILQSGTGLLFTLDVVVEAFYRAVSICLKTPVRSNYNASATVNIELHDFSSSLSIGSVGIGNAQIVTLFKMRDQLQFVVCELTRNGNTNDISIDP
ncbi:Concanavalin A-like lectin/glucanase domain [Phytophthora cactorum]|nr:Concanavalin A-like lectin/glucanase domain [Phytophthora cactorum]